MARRAGISEEAGGERPHAGRRAREHGTTRRASWLVCVALIACASKTPPAARPEPEPNPVVVPESPRAPKAQEAPTAATLPTTDACHVDDELTMAHAALASKEPVGPWLAAARSRLLSHEDAERSLGGIAQEIVSALAYRHYEKLRNFADEDGICLRAARGAACETLTLAELTACGHFGKRRAWAVDEGKDAPPEYTCGEAFRKIFYARDFLRVPEVRFNCFPEANRSKNGAPIVLSGPSLGYVEFHDPGPADGTWRSLWLVFDGEPSAPVLVEMISDY